jgi:hypothetical protein
MGIKAAPKPVKQNKKLAGAKKLERKVPLLMMRPLKEIF